MPKQASLKPIWLKLNRLLRVAVDLNRTRRSRTRAARYAAALAERLGIIARPRACQWCQRPQRGRLGRLERHHVEYAEPLAILWLCRTCHADADRMDWSEAG